MGVRVGVANFFGSIVWALEWAWQNFFFMGVRVGMANFFWPSIGIDETNTFQILDRY